MRLLAAAMIAGCWAAPAAASPFSGEAALVSDFRYRGVSLSDGNPALQAALNFEHPSGFHANLWTSTLRRIGSIGHSEIDVTAGYEREIAKGLFFDLSATRYFYPSSGSENYSEGTATLTLEQGAASASLGLSYAPPQRALCDGLGRRRGNGYIFGQGGIALPRIPVTITASAGYERGAFDEVRNGGKWDWSLDGEFERGPAKLALTYVGSTADSGSDALVGTLTLSW